MKRKTEMQCPKIKAAHAAFPNVEAPDFILHDKVATLVSVQAGLAF